MAPPAIRIRVGATVDSSVEKTFAQVEVRAQKAYGITVAAAKKARDQTAAAAQDAAAKAGAAAEKAAAKEGAAIDRTAAKGEAAAKKLQDGFANSFTKIANVAEREMLRVQRAQDRASRRVGERFAQNTSRSAARFLTPYAPLASIARRTANDIARGMGVDFNIGSAVARNVDRESLATSLSNSGFQENNAGPNGKRIDASLLRKEAHDTGLATATDPTAMLEASRGFVGITGNLDQARQTMGELAKISKATTSNIEDVSKAAGKINAQLEDTPSKAQDTLAIIRLLAGQGKLGAAEMEDYAKSIGKIAGNAHQFKGEFTKNIAQLSAMAQQSVQSGTSGGPVQAATGISSFANTFSKAARVKEFNARHIDFQNLSPQQIILKSLQSTKGDNLGMASLFADTRARSVVKPYEQIFNAARGGRTDTASLAAGSAAVEAAFKRLTDGAMSQAEVEKEFAAQMGTTKSKAELFQIKLDDIVGKLQEKVLPAFDELSPKILALANVLGDVATWAISNPKEAIAAGISASIARAGIESTLRSGIERLILGGASGPNASTVGAVASNLGAALTIGAISVTTFEVGKMIVKDMFADAAVRDRERVEKDVGAFGKFSEAQRLLANPETASEGKKNLEAFIAEKQGNKDASESIGAKVGALLTSYFDIDARALGGKEAVEARRAAEDRQMQANNRELAQARALLTTISATLSGGIRINNLPGDGRSSQ